MCVVEVILILVLGAALTCCIMRYRREKKGK